MNKSYRALMMVILAAGVAGSESAAGGDSMLWGWNISAGGNFGFGLKTDLTTSSANAMKCMPAIPTPVGPTKQQAMEAATITIGGKRYVYDEANDLYVDPNSAEADPRYTVNWKLPDSAVRGTGGNRYFELDGGSWGEIVSSSETVRDLTGSDDSVAYGASVELSHALWSSEEGNWGVDIAIGLTWMRANDCHRSSGVVANRSATEEGGNVSTTVSGDFFRLPWADQPEDDNTWGNGTYAGDDYSRNAFELDLASANTFANTGYSRTYSDSLYMSSRGDYEEWEISILLRPWYDVTDWLCVHGTIGLGVTRSSFDYSMEALCNGTPIYRSSEEFDEWRCYGIAGAGVLLRAWDFNFSCDGLFRWCQQDMEIDGKDVHGTLEKPWGVIRLGLSYDF